MSVLIEIFGDYTEDFMAAQQSEPNELTVALASGFGGERIFTIFLEVTKLSVGKAIQAVQNAVQPDLVRGIKISRDGVEIGSMRLRDAEKVKAFAVDILRHLE